MNGKKELLAHKFAQKYINDVEGFKRFLVEGIGVAGDYAETRKYLGEDTHSLERCPNPHLVLEGGALQVCCGLAVVGTWAAKRLVLLDEKLIKWQNKSVFYR